MTMNVVGVVALVKVFFPWLRRMEHGNKMKKIYIFFVVIKA